jgi:hypothetical protein
MWQEIVAAEVGRIDHPTYLHRDTAKSSIFLSTRFARTGVTCFRHMVIGRVSPSYRKPDPHVPSFSTDLTVKKRSERLA